MKNLVTVLGFMIITLAMSGAKAGIVKTCPTDYSASLSDTEIIKAEIQKFASRQITISNCATRASNVINPDAVVNVGTDQFHHDLSQSGMLKTSIFVCDALNSRDLKSTIYIKIQRFEATSSADSDGFSVGSTSCIVSEKSAAVSISSK